MPTTLEIKLPPAELHDPEALRRAVSRKGISEQRIGEVIVDRRSIDARGSHPVYRLRVEVRSAEEGPAPEAPPTLSLRDVSDAPPVVVVGCGPAGMFAALELIELGLRPILLERGRDVRSRRRSLRAIQQFGEVDPDSNYCFGEGGAGTYSDGKLYTRSLKRGNYLKALRTLVDHGAQADILIDAHPHIGSNKLPQVVANMRETILAHGGEIRFGHRLTDLEYDQDLRALLVTDDFGSTYRLVAEAYILATGHSARDVYHLLDRHGIRLEAKPFALGVRIEHPQSLIDRIQYGQSEREENLPASSYKLVTQVKERGVFSFCMCPGGLVVPAATAPGEIVVNGMSLSRRDSPYANSGTVVAVEVEDLAPYAAAGVFAGLAFQEAVERAMFASGDGTQQAPAQRLPDFVAGKISRDLPASSYIPGLHTAPLHDLLPAGIYDRLRQGVQDFGRKMRGYFTAEANVIGVESRTSSPVRIPRDRHSYQHPEAASLYPCGEGAGFAGGILSAAMDGQNVARAVAAKVKG
ncbi:NAD(P)/FAD-dependent oxidoreductase [Lewinella sp. JB7]|uniref:NAD(P)/FAD-dependent oxidoreductase n=1 Tax=Lewinella sp. JB7 TaxID=2962887 RepID=UPI0020C978CC|nr:FAD-dependent monooxygenase [Lewinella sp. JB7]MCP9237497.1 FAD-dependent monooxygenase [Lewinella sp. JB7]